MRIIKPIILFMLFSNNINYPSPLTAINGIGYASAGINFIASMYLYYLASDKDNRRNNIILGTTHLISATALLIESLLSINTQAKTLRYITPATLTVGFFNLLAAYAIYSDEEDSYSHYKRSGFIHFITGAQLYLMSTYKLYKI